MHPFIILLVRYGPITLKVVKVALIVMPHLVTIYHHSKTKRKVLLPRKKLND